jgi:7-cyano-7-deazaguanine synthase
MQKIVLGLSGGLDSSTLLAYLLKVGYEVHVCTFYYGSKHGKYENRAAENIIDYYLNKGAKVIPHVINLEGAFASIESNLMKSGGEIPEGHYQAKNMSKTVVPGRNLIFASIMSGIAESIGAEAIALGSHAGDHHIYPDCRPEFNIALEQVVKTSTDGKVSIIIPFQDWTKQDIVKYGIANQVPYELTRTCYKDQPVACGKCGSCVERKEAFENLNLKDPVQYE